MNNELQKKYLSQEINKSVKPEDVNLIKSFRIA